MRDFLSDCRYGLRMLARQPTFTWVAAVTLALAIGANTSIFSAVYGVLLRPLPYEDPGRLVQIWGTLEKFDLPRNELSEPEYWDLRSSTRSFSDIAVYHPGQGANLTNKEAVPLRVSVLFSSANLFSILGTTPVLGRAPHPEEGLTGRGRIALISQGLWRSRFGSDAAIVGKSIRLDAGTYEIIGVLSSGLDFAGDHDVWIPLRLDRAQLGERADHHLKALARLARGVTLAQASLELDQIALRLEQEHPRHYGGAGFGLFPSPLHDEIVGNARPALLVLLGAAGFVLLIACANIANLLLARAASREREIAIRTALGAGRLRLARQLLTEGLLLALLGGGLGVLLASWGSRAFRTLAPDILPRMQEIRLDSAVLGFTLGLSVLTGILFSLAPGLHLAVDRLSESLREGIRGRSGSSRKRMHAALVVTEIAIALVLLVGAGLLIRSFQNLLAADPGFAAERTLTFQVSLPENLYASGQPVTGFYRELTDRIARLPGVQSAGAVSHLPLSGAGASGSVFIEDTTVSGLMRMDVWNASILEADKRYATPGYFQAMGIPLLKGRLFEKTDDYLSSRVVIVDSEFAEHIWPNRDPIGQRVAFYPIPGSDPPVPLWWTVAGVVGHVKHESLRVEGREQIYMPHAQSLSVRTMTMAVRSHIEPTSLVATVREAVSEVDADLPLYDVRTIEQTLSASTAEPWINLMLIGSFAALALILAAVGMYGVTAYSVAQRYQEMGIRVALGAKRRDIFRLMFSQGLRLTFVGTAIGTVIAFSLTRVMSGLLFGVSAGDPLTYAAISILLVCVALAATLIPARRATKVDPIVVLRCE